MRVKIHKIHREGRGILITLFLILALLNVASYYVIQTQWIFIFLLSFSVLLFLVVLNFFRSPRRVYPGYFNEERDVIASADGVIVAVEEVMENEYFKDKRIQVSIFMNLFNVHANWFPVAGKVLHVGHQNGRFMSAYLPKSSTENERSTIVIEMPNGEQVLARQIAGACARRIVTYAEVGDECSIDEHMGFIKFGSRVDLFLPLNTEVFVKIGDKTVGGITKIAQLPFVE
ncbi:MAG: phosphatidylserine decarboxylase family protein [Bacteroidales bacterium]|nr:phosphatidylserine decarboxylase family protein [Bacteroidales bacterium]